MSNPESGPAPYEESTPEQLEKIDQTLDAYGQVLRDIEEQGPDKLRLAQRELLENQLRELRSTLPIRPETDAVYREEVKNILAEAYRHGRLESINRDQARAEEGLTPEFFAVEERVRQARGQAPSPKDATEAALLEAAKKAEASTTPEVNETDPIELAKMIASSHEQLIELLYAMEDDVMRNHVNLQEEPDQFSKDELDVLRIVDSTRSSYDRFEETMRRAYPGSDFGIPESQNDIPVESKRDIAFAISQRLGILKRFRDDYLKNHPHREGAE